MGQNGGHGAAVAGAASQAFLAGGGEMGERMRAFDWAATSLGSCEGWPQSLKTAVRIMLTSRQPIWIGWGPDLIFFYNDPYKAIIGGKHPHGLGRPTAVVWREIWHDIGPMLSQAMTGIEGTYVEGQLLVMERNGYPEETYYTFSYSPIPDDDGSAGGIICANTDDTRRVIGERQLALLRDLAAGTADARNRPDVCARAAAALAGDRHDLPFAMIYLSEPGGGATLAGVQGIGRDHPAAPQRLEFGASAPWPMPEKARGVEVVEGLAERFAAPFPTGPWTRPADRAAVLPLPAASETGQDGLLVVGLNPFRLFDDGYRGFLDLVAGQIAGAIGNADAYEGERRRAEALAEVDRAKTAFFSNVSHEFRTPLTLMLGPLEEALADAERLPAAEVERVRIVHRNGLRLLRMVNALLDVSRLEAGRVQARFQPTDLAALTAELASNFRSATEKAGLALVVDCPPLPRPVHVDRDSWEKIVLNLLSNAFKFTLEGEIAVVLRPAGASAELVVRDTGTGIPEHELPRLFERFHRVANAAGRSHEGSGIGLSLSQELIRLHGGTVRVESVVGRGTAFTVTIPFGTAHLPPELVQEGEPAPASSGRAEAFVEEALRWLPDAAPADVAPGAAPEGAGPPPAGRPRIVLADDNADMRDYVRRLLAGRYAVEAVADGEAALAAVRAARPDLLLTDVMMPRLDGFGLVRAVRGDPALADLPIILLSARAGEDESIEGFEVGADDYLVKPFSARELVARVGATLELARVRRQAAEAVRESEARFRHLADNAPVLVWATEPDGRCSFLSRSWFEYTGQTSDEGLGFGWLDAVHPEDRPRSAEIFGEANARRAAFRLEYRLRRADGRYRWAIDAAAPRFAEDGTWLGYIGSVLDVHERTEILERLRDSERRFRDMANAMPQLVWTADATGHVDFYNDRVGAYAGLSDGGDEHWTWAPALHADDRAATLEAWNRAVATGEPFQMEHRVAQAGGGHRWHISRAIATRDTAGAVVRWYGTATDVHDLKAAQEALRTVNAGLERRIEEAAAQLVQMQKMESIGRLTGGIAHDFNNLLMAILTSLEVVKTRLPAGDARLPKLIDNAMQAAHRGASLTQRMLAFARKQELKPEPVAIPELVFGMTELLTRSLGPQVRIDTRFPVGTPKALVDANQLEMAILNLAVNARDAMPDGGTLTIAAEATPEGFVRLVVGDTGVGMDEATLRRATEPFFTTKGAGKGTGLGLSMVHGLAAQSGGRFVLRSAPGAGTTAEILLPVARSEAWALAKPSPPPAPEPGGADGRRLTVLVVDDDPLVLMGMVTVLEALGHDPVRAGSGREALELLADGCAVDVVVTDQVMPGMTGIQLATAIRGQRPDLPIVLATGYAELPDGAHRAFSQQLRKPFRPNELALALARAAESRSTGTDRA
ncbi:ATP-binding protein [Azospirillum sp. ST 5-10]|uniref:ATP-binding protein n=1 Tax=unclassified Azospirillum TaxID=2630922 RepID=UPI003F4A2B1F